MAVLDFDGWLNLVFEPFDPFYCPLSFMIYFSLSTYIINLLRAITLAMCLVMFWLLLFVNVVVLVSWLLLIKILKEVTF